MISVESYVQQGKDRLTRWVLDPAVQQLARLAGYWAGGFVLSAASLENGALPLCAALVIGLPGWAAVMAAAGSAMGYWVFWGRLALQPVVWLCFALPISLLAGKLRCCREQQLLLPACGMLITAGTGLGFQLFTGSAVPLLLYLLRVGLTGCCTWLFARARQSDAPIPRWLTAGFFIFSLAQILPLSWLGLGYIAAGAVTVAGAFPGAAVAGLALDLAGVTPVPMTAVTVVGALTGLLPKRNVWLTRLAPGVLSILFMQLAGVWDLRVVPGLFIGGFLGTFLPGPGKLTRRKGETGAAQVRLEMAAGVLTQTQELLGSAWEQHIDTSALVSRAAERACRDCPRREGCEERALLPGIKPDVLDKPLSDVLDIPVVCKKSGLFLKELQLAQGQFRTLRSDRRRQQEYREALVQQYRFLSQFLQELADGLPRRTGDGTLRYSPEISVYGNRPAGENGDRCLRFPGPGGRYYVLLCDGMGTGSGAVREGKTAAGILQQLLTAGFPAAHALRSLNSLCVLRDMPGAVTMDLAELHLDTGKAVLYKWGAAPSYVVSRMGAQKMGTVTPPPGLSVEHMQEKTWSLTLRTEQILLMVSDGLEQEETLEICAELAGSSPADIGTELLRQCCKDDDATVVTIRLKHS